MAFDVDSKDVGEAIRGLKRTDPEETAAESFREQTPALVNEARGRMSSRDGGGTYPRRSGQITEDRSGIRLNVGGAFPWAKGAEFGSRSAWVFGRRLPASSLSRPQFAAWSGQTFSLNGKVGYHIGETLRQNVDDMAQTALDDVADEYVAELKRAGVPTRG